MRSPTWSRARTSRARSSKNLPTVHEGGRSGARKPVSTGGNAVGRVLGTRSPCGIPTVMPMLRGGRGTTVRVWSGGISDTDELS